MLTDLIGKTITDIKGKKGEGEMIFTLDDGSQYRMWHEQDCCETVYLEDIIGDLNDLIGTPVLNASTKCSSELLVDSDIFPIINLSSESQTWTFYEIATIKGYVTIRWYGSSNGYYSESVSFEKI